ncbi:MAG: alpha-2-macroglobulin family protein [Odoribacter sp.]
MVLKYYFSIIFALSIFLWNGCSNKEQADFSPYITGYTSGVIPSSSDVLIYLGQQTDSKFQPGSLLPNDIIQISPSIRGKLTLKDNNKVEFTPSEAFQNGTTYEVTFNLGALCQVPEKYQIFRFQFEIIPLTIVYETGYLTTEPEEDSALQYKCLLQCSDEIDATEIEKKISASYCQQSIIPEWTHEGNKHYFSIRHLTKGKNSQTLKLQFSKEIKNGEDEVITIPKINDFTVLNVRSEASEASVICVYMSENIDPIQNLTGLISIENDPKVNIKVNGNILYLYPQENSEQNSFTLTLHPGIRSQSGHILSTTFIRTIRSNTLKPQVKFIGKGVIVPGDQQVLIPFSAIALKTVDIEIIQVLNQNMNFFLQENSYDDHSELTRTARPIFLKQIDLAKDHPGIDLNKWNDYTINLPDLVKLEKGTIYRIRLKFKKSYTTLPCANESPDSEYNTSDWDNPNYYYSDYSYPTGYEWAQRNNPCHVSYYMGERFEARNIINTSLGLMAKQGVDNRYVICVTDLITATPIAGCQVDLYNYQTQKIDSARTDKDGFVQLKSKGKAFIVLAQKNGDKAWLRLADGNALSLSNFDVSGQQVQMGVKGFIYGERGVWRPGDEIYLSLILEDKLGILPEGHPIVAQLTDPNGHIIQTIKNSISKNNIYCFTFKTAEEAQTGHWQALFRIGGLTFMKTLRIETIKPNRLAIQMDFPNEKIIGKGVPTTPVKVSTRWLNGARTAQQKAITEVRLYNGDVGFETFPNYTFSDQSKYFEPATETLFDGTTDANGNFSFNLNKIHTDNAPGILNATFTSRVFETGGDFSLNTQSIYYSPYTEYVGIRLPKTEDNWYSTSQPVRLSGVTVTPFGKQSGNSTIRIEVYKLDWHWWWDSEDKNLSSYINREYSRSIWKKEVKALNGAFTTDLNLKEYGRYFIRVTHPSGHTSGIIAWFGSWSDNTNQEIAAMLRINTDKEAYQVGEKIQVTIPSSEGAIAIVSLENGKTIHNIRRIVTKAGSTTFELDAVSDMCPNTYIAVSLIQPHSDRDNDRPIRLYGVANINIEDPTLHLQPEINIPSELQPGKDFTVAVKEKHGKTMNYTIAIVDEGLLSLTSFRTPDPFQTFYAREALGVKTWDFYDYIYGAYGARLDKAFAIGGDEALKNKQDEKTNRFKPVVLFKGPFTLKPGQTSKHTFKMPEYIGEVRTTVVAATNGQYGATAANSTVSKPLMISVALPRLLTPGDQIDIPVTVFAMKNNIQEVTVKMNTDSKITLTGNTSQQVHFKGIGEQVVYFNARINQQTGVSTLRTEAIAGKETAFVKEDITVRVPNPRITTIVEKEAKAGETVSFNTPISGDKPKSVLEISSIPPLNLEQRMAYLLDYPHGCAEQIISQAFPQLSLSELLELTATQQMQTETNIREVINRLPSYQTSSGGFSYWSGSPNISEWVTSYAIQFLVSARQKGYAVPLTMLQNAINYLKRASNSWNLTEPWSQQEQAYRLYVLALAGKPDMPAMNRLKETTLKRPVSQWLLASAYALGNQKEMAEKMIHNLSTDVAPYRETGGTFGSDTRDQALILQSMIHLNRQQDAYRMLGKIARAMGSEEWYSTQETALALNAAAQYVKTFLGTQKGIQIVVTQAAEKENIKTEKTIWQQALTLRNGTSAVTVQNKGTGNLYVRQINSSASLEVIATKISSGLSMEVRYVDDQGTPLNINRLKQGQDLTTEITIKNTGLTGTYQELALSYLVPSGFEIINTRLTGAPVWTGAENVNVRDDRFYVYFSLEQNRSKTFKFRCNAAFRGIYMLPAINCSAMYDQGIQAVLPGGKITIE